MNKKKIGFIAGILVAVIIMLLPLSNSGLSHEGQLCLALSLMTVVFWAMNVAQSGFVGGVYLALLIILKVATPDVVFKAWYGSSTMWLVIGAYMIAAAVKDSGLGERIAYGFIKKFVRSYTSIIISIFVLTFILSLLIPHPWPRAFLIMAVMSVVIKSADIPKEDAVKIGFTVFAASVPVSLIFLTGDSVINPLAASYATDMEITFLKWFVYMGPPAIVASIITCILVLILFKPTKKVEINIAAIEQKQKELGKMSELEIRTLVWLVIAVVLWLTDSIHGINVGWVTMIIAMLMSMPVIGEVLTVKSWSNVPVHVLVFLTSAMAIGSVGGVTGMNEWLATTILPATLPSNLFVFALLLAVVAIIVHMFMGSVIAVMGVLIPSLLIATGSMGVPMIVVALLVYMAIASHYILPFHHLNMLVGQGEENGMYTQKETIKLGVPLTVVVFVLMLVCVAWWKIIGLC